MFLVSSIVMKSKMIKNKLFAPNKGRFIILNQVKTPVFARSVFSLINMQIFQNVGGDQWTSLYYLHLSSKQVTTKQDFLRTLSLSPCQIHCNFVKKGCQSCGSFNWSGHLHFISMCTFWNVCEVNHFIWPCLLTPYHTVGGLKAI